MAPRKIAPCCCCCGQLLPPKVDLPPVKQRIYEYVSRHPEGVNRSQLADYVYADDPDGGPDGAVRNMSVHVNQINKKLAPLGICIRGRGGLGSVFTLRAL